MRYIISLLVLVALSCNQPTSAKQDLRGKDQTVKMLLKSSQTGIYKPARCSQVLRYTINAKSGQWVEIVECINLENRWSVFFRGFGDTYWEERFLY